MSGTMAQFEDASPFDKRENAKNPVLPIAERDDCSDEVVGESKRMVEQVEEEAHEALD